MKSSRVLNHLAMVLLIGFNAVFMAGCSFPGSPRPFNVSIERDPAVRESSTRFWVGPGNKAASTPLIKDNLDSLIEGLKTSALSYNAKLILFTNNLNQASLSKYDEAWPLWLSHEGNNADSLVIIVDLPGKNFSGGPEDPRRFVLGLGHKYWRDLPDGTIRVRVKPEGIDLITVPASK